MATVVEAHSIAAEERSGNPLRSEHWIAVARSLLLLIRHRASMIRRRMVAPHAGSTTTRIIDGVVETIYVGAIDRHHIDEVTDDVCAALAEIGGGHWLVLARIEGFRVAPEESIRFFTAFRAAGGKRIAVVASKPIRLVAVALSFVSGVAVEPFATREAALAYLRSPT